MIHEKSDLIKHCNSKIGGGGIKCACCFPRGRSGKQMFRHLMKAYRRKMKQHTMRELVFDQD